MILNQAIDSVTGDLYTWRSSEPDWAGAGYPGPNAATEVAAILPTNPEAATTVTDPDTGFTVQLLPQADYSPQSTDATVDTLESVTLEEGYTYEFSAYCHAYSAAYANETYQRFDGIFKRQVAGAAVEIVQVVGLAINPLAIPGLTLSVSGNDVDIKWTGKAATTLKARCQVGWVKRPIVLP